MATDSTQPRSGLILRLALLAIVTLLVVHGALNAYYDRMARAENLRKRGDATPEALAALRSDEKARLSGGGTPIDKAMLQLTEKGRMAASPAIVPAVSKDVAAMQGWTKMPGEVPPAMTAPPPPPPEPGDAGTAAGDGAAPNATKPDAGPPAPQKGGAPHPTHR
jgi:hypothetical protein